MLKKIAKSGLSYDHLKLATERGGMEGLENVLGEKMDNGSLRTELLLGKFLIIFVQLNTNIGIKISI